MISTFLILIEKVYVCSIIQKFIWKCSFFFQEGFSFLFLLHIVYLFTFGLMKNKLFFIFFLMWVGVSLLIQVMRMRLCKSPLKATSISNSRPINDSSDSHTWNFPWHFLFRPKLLKIQMWQKKVSMAWIINLDKFS